MDSTATRRPPDDGMVTNGSGSFMRATSSTNSKTISPSSSLQTNGISTSGNTHEQVALPPPAPPTKPSSLWFCPSRWLMAHHDRMANFSTFKSHVCFVDINHDGDYNLALIDIRYQPGSSATTNNSNSTNLLDTSPQTAPPAPQLQPTTIESRQAQPNHIHDNHHNHHTNTHHSHQQHEHHHNQRNHVIEPPYVCTLKVYRGKKQVYSYRLPHIPSSLNVTAESVKRINYNMGECVLSFTLNSDIRTFNHLRPWRLLSLTDEHWKSATIGDDKFNRLEYESWDMAKKNQVDIDTLYELLNSLKKQTMSLELTSHSINFLSLTSKEEKLDYIKSWRHEPDCRQQLMTQDTICCAAVFSKNDLYELDDQPCRSYLIMGTEDRHVIVYDINEETYIEHFNLPSTPNMIISDWRILADKSIEYKLIVSCRDLKLYQIVYPDTKFRSSSDSKRVRFDIKKHQYQHQHQQQQPNQTIIPEVLPVHDDGGGVVSMDQLAGASGHLGSTILQTGSAVVGEDQSSMSQNKNTTTITTTTSTTNNNNNNNIKIRNTEISGCSTGQGNGPSDEVLIGPFIQLNSFALDMTWFGQHRCKYLAVACVDRRVYCYNHLGSYIWSIREETPITCLESVTNFRMSINLLAVASQSNRIDFYEINGRIVDTIYLGTDYATVIKFGRYGREDNCLCIITRLGHLRILILKRMAKFADGQCLSSAAAAASQQQQQQQRTNQTKPPPTPPSSSSASTMMMASSSNNDFDSGNNVQIKQHQQQLGLNVSPSLLNDDQQQQDANLTLMDEATQAKMLTQIMNMTLANQQIFHQQQQQLTSTSNSYNVFNGHQNNNNNMVRDPMQTAPISMMPPSNSILSSNGDSNQAQGSSRTLKIPTKSHLFVEQVADQADRAMDIHRKFTSHLRFFKNQMIKGILRSEPSLASGSRISLVKLKGLGPIYKLTLSVRLELCHLLRANSDRLTNNNGSNNNKEASQEGQYQQQVGQSSVQPTPNDSLCIVSADDEKSIRSSSNETRKDDANDITDAASPVDTLDRLLAVIRPTVEHDITIGGGSQNSMNAFQTKTRTSTSPLGNDIVDQLAGQQIAGSNKNTTEMDDKFIPSTTVITTTTTTTSTTSTSPATSVQRELSNGITTTLFGLDERYDIMLLLFASSNHLKLMPKSFKLGNLRHYQLEMGANRSQRKHHSSILTSKISLTLRVSSQCPITLDRMQSLKVCATVPAYQVPLHMCTIELPLSETSF